jgi:hypothetical protein
MRLKVLVVMLFCCVGCIAQEQKGDRSLTSHRSEEEQAVAILLADNGLAPIPGFLETRVSQLGDDAAVGVMQYLGERKTTVSGDSTSPEEIRRILDIIRMAFALPNSKRVPADGKGVPRATLVLLEYLSCLPSSASVRNELADASRLLTEAKMRELK